jgi:hypothetical protein
LIAATLSGRRGDTQALGMLLTLELFQRQFLEGEEPDAQAYDWPATDET